MTRAVQGSVLPLAKRHVVWRLNDTRATLLGVCEVPGDVIDRDMDIRADLVAMGRAKRTPLPTDDNGTISNQKLRMTDHVAATGSQALTKPKYAAQPFDRFGYVIIHKDRYNSSIWSGTILHGLRRIRSATAGEGELNLQ
jgi:hypothetical protein